MSEVVLYLTFEGEPIDPRELEQRIAALDSVESSTAEVEETERSGVAGTLTEVTLVLTATTGVVGGVRLLLDDVAGVVKSFRNLKGALVETPDGAKPIAEAAASDA